jgi:catechol 2,3-dioxygenase-like lactoylglutathione lyase family enzyme
MVPRDPQPQTGSEPDAYCVRRIHHIGITVGELDRSLRFYRDLLGMGVIERSEDEDVGAIVGIRGAHVRAADLDAGNGQILELLEYASGHPEGHIHGPDTVGSLHLSLQIGELSAALLRLEKAGFVPMAQPAGLSGGVWDDCTVAYIRDPDGVILELIERGAGG